MSDHKATMQRLDSLENSLASSQLSGVTIESERGQSVLSNLLAQATSPDFDHDSAKESVIKGLGLKLK